MSRPSWLEQNLADRRRYAEQNEHKRLVNVHGLMDEEARAVLLANGLPCVIISVPGNCQWAVPADAFRL